MNKKDSLETILYYLLLFMLISLPTLKLLSYILYLAKVIDDVYSINQVYVLWIGLAPLIVIYIMGVSSEKYEFNLIDYLGILLVGFAIVSTIFSVNQEKSMYGEIYRYEGLLSILSYYFIFLNAKNIKNKEYKENLIFVFLMLGIVQVVYGMLQVYTNVGFIKHSNIPYMAMALSGNPNFFGSYVLMHLLMTTSLYFTKKQNRYLILSVIYFIGLCLASSTGPFLTFFIASLFFIIVFHKKIKIKKFILFAVVLLIAYFANDKLVTHLHNNVFHNPINRSYNITTEIADTVKNITSEESKNFDILANGRVQIWKNSLPLVKKYWVVGSGLDTFANVYEYNSKYLVYDKAHNVYLQMAITNGIFPLITYCIICLIVFIKGFKFKDPMYIALYIAFVGYCIQAFGNISVIDVAPSFFLILGLLFTKKSDEYETN